MCGEEEDSARSGARACGDSVARSQLIVQSAVNVHKTVVQQVHAPRRDATFDRVACINVATEALAYARASRAREMPFLAARAVSSREPIERSIPPFERHAFLITLQRYFVAFNGIRGWELLMYMYHRYHPERL